MEILLIIYMAFSLNSLSNTNFLSKQIIWFSIGFFLYEIFKHINLRIVYKWTKYIYIILNIFLMYLLIFGNSINGAKAWINLGIFSFQPSEFMKIVLIIYLSLLNNEKIYKLILITLIPSVLTFLEPDTGNVLFYFIILSTIIIKNKKINIIKPLIFFLISIMSFIGLYFMNQNMFIDIFGTSFFYRFDRVVNLFNNSSYQLREALIGIGTSGYFGNNKKINIPASTTDFIFSKIIIKSGLIGGILYLITNYIFNIKIIKKIKKNHGIKYNIGYSGISLKIVQEMIHILMNIGLFPIIGITLPFISYGGSSIITYFIIFGIIDNNMDYKDHNRED